MDWVGAAAMPAVICMILVFGYVRGVDVFDAFVEGAKEGALTSFRILPTLIGLITAVTMVRASGLLDMVCGMAEPIAEALGISPEIVPLGLLRPISGSGSMAYTLSIFQRFGPDSETGRIASVLSSATETTFYAIAVYFGACGYKKLRWTVPAALLGDCAALIFAVLTVKLFG